jgi:RHS repeat-associated protein
MNDGSASTWSWDSLGRLLSFSDSNGTVSYTFTDNGAGATSIVYPGGKTVGRTYDDAGRLLTTTGWTGGAATFGHDDNSNPTTINAGATAGVEDTYGYDRANRMTAFTLRENTAVRATLGYTRDREGMVTQTTATGSTSSLADSFTYGPFDQLASSSSGTYSYDSADNLIGFPDGRKQKFNAANELCYTATTNTAACGSAPAGATRYDYDARGDRIAKRPDNNVPTILGYDQADRLTSAKVPAVPGNVMQYHDMSGANVTYTSASWVANQSTDIQVTGANGIPATSVESVVVRLHVAAPGAFGYLQAYPTGTSTTTAAMFFDTGDATSNVAISKLSAAGKVTVKTSTATYVTVELVGWYGTDPVDGGVTFEPVTASRALYTAVSAGGTTPGTQITGAFGVPATGVSAVAVVVHAIGATSTGYLKAYSGTTAPSTYTLLYDSASASALTIVPLAADGKIKVNSSQATSVAVDIVGYYTDVETGNGNIGRTVEPSIIVDTINHVGVCNGGTCNQLPASTPVTAKVTGVGGIPVTGVSAVAVVFSAFYGGASGYLTAYATGTARPAIATMTFDGDAYISGTAIVPVGADGTITLWSYGALNLSIQPVGWYEAARKTYTFTYSGDGLRKQKTGNGTTIKYVWDRSSAIPELLAEEIDAPGTSGDKTVRYLYGPGGTVTADIATPAGGGTETLRWYHHDQLGSTVALTYSNGGAAGTYNYTPVGALTSPYSAETTPIGGAGEYRDDETGFIYLRARYYDPATAQFLTRDPLESVTRSAYGYASNNPLNVIDPSGLFPGGGILGGIADFFTGGGCGDGFLAGFGDALGSIRETATSALDDVTALVGNNWRTWTAIAAVGTCILATAGSACIAVLGAGFLARSAGTVATHGFNSGTFKTIGADAVWTAASIAVAGTTSGVVGPQSAGPVLIPAMSTTGTRLVQALPAGFDAAMVQWGPTWIPG